MKLYLAGPMRGYPDFNREAFEKWAKILRSKGHEVFSPREHSDRLFGPKVLEAAAGDENKMGGDQMTISRTVFSLDLQYICLHADAVAVIPGWEKSRGATAEVACANALPIKIIPVENF